MMTTYLGSRSLAVAPFAARGLHVPCSKTAAPGRLVDAWGLELGLATLPGGTDTVLHDACEGELFRIMTESGVRLDIQPSHIFATAVAVPAALDPVYGRPPAIVPDAAAAVSLPPVTPRNQRQGRPLPERVLLFDVKTIHGGGLGAASTLRHGLRTARVVPWLSVRGTWTVSTGGMRASSTSTLTVEVQLCATGCSPLAVCEAWSSASTGSGPRTSTLSSSSLPPPLPAVTGVCAVTGLWRSRGASTSPSSAAGSGALSCVSLHATASDGSLSLLPLRCRVHCPLVAQKSREVLF